MHPFDIPFDRPKVYSDIIRGSEGIFEGNELTQSWFVKLFR